MEILQPSPGNLEYWHMRIARIRDQNENGDIFKISELTELLDTAVRNVQQHGSCESILLGGIRNLVSERSFRHYLIPLHVDHLVAIVNIAGASPANIVPLPVELTAMPPSIPELSRSA